MVNTPIMVAFAAWSTWEVQWPNGYNLFLMLFYYRKFILHTKIDKSFFNSKNLVCRELNFVHQILQDYFHDFVKVNQLHMVEQRYHFL